MRLVARRGHQGEAPIFLLPFFPDKVYFVKVDHSFFLTSDMEMLRSDHIYIEQKCLLR